MGPGHVLPRLPGKARARGKAKIGKPEKREAGLVVDRMGALAVGVLIGLGTVLIDRRRDPASGQAPADLRGRARYAGGGWLGVARRTWAEFTEDRIPAVAAGSTFYALLALFPALGVFVSLYGLLADVGEAQRQIAGLRGLLPEGGITVLSEQVNRLAAQPQCRPVRPPPAHGFFRASDRHPGPCHAGLWQSRVHRSGRHYCRGPQTRVQRGDGSRTSATG